MMYALNMDCGFIQHILSHTNTHTRTYIHTHTYTRAHTYRHKHTLGYKLTQTYSVAHSAHTHTHIILLWSFIFDLHNGSTQYGGHSGHNYMHTIACMLCII